MCGRFTQRSEGPALVRRFAVQHLLFPVFPRYNVAPSQTVAIVTGAPDDRSLRSAFWGFTPMHGRAHRPLINARGETVDKLPTFRDAFAHHRCLIPADGFYEWRVEPSGAKTPMFIHLSNDAPFAFAGLYSPARDDADEPPTCAVITTEANDVLRPIHDRMPVILPRGAEAAWLGGDPDEALRLLKPYDPAAMSAYPVSRRENKPAYDDASLIERVDDEPGAQGELFA